MLVFLVAQSPQEWQAQCRLVEIDAKTEPEQIELQPFFPSHGDTEQSQHRRLNT